MENEQIEKLGFGVLVSMIGGNQETMEAIHSALGKKIENVSLVDNQLIFELDGRVKLKVFDDGQSCCETRYMRTDDDLAKFTGATLTSFEIVSAANEPDQYGEPHEVQFLNVTTSLGVFQMANHNEHNGYYGGFALVARID